LQTAIISFGIFEILVIAIIIWYVLRMRNAIQNYIQDLYNREKVLGDVIDEHKERIDEIIHTQTEDEMDISRLRLDVNSYDERIVKVEQFASKNEQLVDEQMKSELMWQKGMEEIMSYSPKSSSSPLRSGGITERINK